MSDSTVKLIRKVEPVGKKVEEKLAMQLFFTELNTTATCLICRQKVLFKEFNMTKHYTAKHAGKYNKYSGEERKAVYDQLHADFSRCRGTTGDPDLSRESKVTQRSPGNLIYLISDDRSSLCFYFEGEPVVIWILKPAKKVNTFQLK